MDKLKGFLEYNRKEEETIAVPQRLQNYKEFQKELSNEELREQGTRCMDCGIPFCHSGCPLGNLIPDFNTAVYRNDWKQALEILHSTNNFPEFTGRLCPAPCESACVLGLIKAPVAIELIEKYIPERGFKEGWIKAVPPDKRTGKTVAVVGSGPAGLAAAQQLNRAGHKVKVLERDKAIGGLLRYGIPDFKMEKWIIDRRLAVLEEEGIEFITNANVGVNFEVSELLKFDAVVLCGGATQKRSLPIPGADAKAVVQAMDFLKRNNEIVAGLAEPTEDLHAKDKHVIVIGGGDTGSDCVGTANRHGAKSVVNFEIMPMPSDHRTEASPWPYWPFTLKTTSSHEEGVERNWSIATREFVTDEDNNLIALKTINVEWVNSEDGRPQLKEIAGSEKEWPCDLVLLAMGFTGPENTLSKQLGLEVDSRTNIKAGENYQTNIPRVFTAGDMRRGQSLIVWAISEGREAARNVDIFLMGKTDLPTKGPGDLPSA